MLKGLVESILMTLIRGRLPFLALHLLVASGMIGQSTGTVRAVGRLEPHQAIERELGTGHTDEYTVEVTAGQFVRVVAQQMGVDVIVRVLDPLDRIVVEADRPNGAFGPEAASLIGEAAGKYRIRVSSGSSTAKGVVRLNIRSLSISSGISTTLSASPSLSAFLFICSIHLLKSQSGAPPW